MRAAVFIERDGVLNLPRIEGRFQIAPRTLSELILNDAALAPLHNLKRAGFLLVATTNQPGISKGYISRRELDAMHALILKHFPLDHILMCPHDDADRCPCRKPKPGLFQEAAFAWNVNLQHSFVISDKWQDAKAAQNAGCTSILLNSPWNGTGHHDYIVGDLASAADKVIRLQKANCFEFARA